MKFLGLLLSLLPTIALAQLEVYPTSPTYMENGDLFGPDYHIFDATFEGSGYAYAQFNGVNSNLGLSRGFVMTTGRLADPNVGILGPNNFTDAGYDLSNIGGYPLLTNLIGGVPTFDAAVLSFKFVPDTDTLVFNYSFGSEEYDEYVGSQFNDPAAIFLLGPGIPAPTNVMTIGGIGVGVNTIHGSVTNTFGTFPPANESYYMDNPVSNDPTTIEYDGFTVNTQVRIEGLTIGDTMQMIIAIADAGDGLFDSGLFIEACETCVPFLGNEVIARSSFKLFPNPAQHSLQIEAEGAHEYAIVNALGATMESGNLIDAVSLDISSLAPGTYLVRLDDGRVERFVKQ